MSAKKEKATKKEFNTEKVSDMAKDLYLANLGVYGKGGDLIKDITKTGDFFKDLVKRGEEVHKSAEKRLKDTESRIKNLEIVKDMKLDDRISELKENFNSIKDKLALKSKTEKKAEETVKTPAKAKAKAKAKVKAADEQVAA